MKHWNHALITGGASGLGLGFALRLLRRGSRVSVLDRSISDSARTALDVAAAMGKSVWQAIEVNVTDEERVSGLINMAVSQYGSPDLVVHCAGVCLNRAVSDTTGRDFRHVINVNLVGSFHVAAAVLPHMKPGSRLALISSMAGVTSNYGYAAYGASKFGVVGLANTLRFEYEPRGIGISCICPPEVKTPLVEKERTPGNFNEISIALKDYAGSLDADFAVDAMLAGLDKGQWMIIPGFQARMVARIYRHLPTAFFSVMNFLVKMEMRKRKIPVAG